MPFENIDNIISEPTTNFFGKDGFYWWIGEVEDNEDPMELGRVKCRVLGYYTNPAQGSAEALPTKHLPWATVLQHTSQAGNDHQGESSGQLQPGAIVMGFFMDGESAQMPIVIGVMRVNKGTATRDKREFVLTGEKMQTGFAPNPASMPVGQPTVQEDKQVRKGDNNSVPTVPSQSTVEPGGTGAPKQAANAPGMPGSGVNPLKPRQPKMPIPAANGVGGPIKTVEMKISYLVEDLADSLGNITKTDDGNFIDTVSGKLVEIDDFMVNIGNFTASIFTQVIAALRQHLSMAAGEAQGFIQQIMGFANGIPFVVMNIVQQIVSAVLKALCKEDFNIMDYVMGIIDGLIEKATSFVEGIIDKATMVLQAAQDAIDSIICQIREILESISGIIDAVIAGVEIAEDAMEIINAWKDSKTIFGSANFMDLLQNGISGLLSIFLKFLGSNCNRTPEGGEATVGYYPLFGVTECTSEELEAFNDLRGSSRGSCGKGKSKGKGESGFPGSGGEDGGQLGMLDSIYADADQYLTSAKNFVNGAFDLHMGTPGRQSTVNKRENGTTHQSVSYNNAEYAEYVARKEMREKDPEASDEEIQKKVEKFKKKNGKSKDDGGNLVADHISYAGTKTEETHGDNCQTVDGHKVVNVEGDYHLKITGNCHIEVGGGFFLSAEGSPQAFKKKGKASKGKRAQKHTIRFGSDVDINAAGAKVGIQAAEIELAAQSSKSSGGNFESTGGNTTLSGGEVQIIGENSVDIITPCLYELINVSSPIPGLGKAGIFRTIKGSEQSTLLPGGSVADAVPLYMVANPAGPIDMTCSVTGFNLRAITGAVNMNAVAGLANITASTVTNITGGTAVNIAALAGPVKITGVAIFLN